MRGFLFKVKNVVARCRDSCLSVLPSCYVLLFLGECVRILEFGFVVNSLLVGLCKRSKARCLLDRFGLFGFEVLWFVFDFRVLFDNNLVERD